MVYLIYRRDYKNFYPILFGVTIGWAIFFIFLPNNEISAFLENTKIVFSSSDYLDGLIYPTPFISKDARSTRALLLIIITGILISFCAYPPVTRFLLFLNKGLLFNLSTHLSGHRSG